MRLLLLCLAFCLLQSVESAAQSIVGFSHPRGFYASEFDLVLTPPSGATVHYTLNGSEPTLSSPVASGPIPIRSRDGEPNTYSMISGISNSYAPWAPPKGEVFKITVLRAAAFQAGQRVTPIHTNSYIIHPAGADRYSLPVVSLVTDSLHLFDHQSGIYVLGKIYEDWKAANPFATENGGTPANFTQSGDVWERPVHIEFFEDDGRTAFAQDAGIRMHGNWARAFRQKTFRLYARNDYGSNRFDYQLFPDKPLTDYRRFILRNSGQDWAKTMLRDGFMQQLARGLSFDTQYYRPSIVFVNGEYWGIHNIRDRYDDHYIESHYGVPRGSIDFLELNAAVQEGSADHYKAMTQYLNFNVLTDNSRLDYVKTQMDVVNFGEYVMTQVYLNNRDWPHNNIDYWRRATSVYQPYAPYGHDGRWRWMMKDTDFGFGWLVDVNAWKNDHLAVALNPSGERAWSTLIFRRLMDNASYRTWFITRYMDLLNTNFEPQRVLNTLDSLVANIEPEMDEHLNRWGVQDHRFSPPADLDGWQENLDLMRHFAENRPGVIRDLLKNRYNLGDAYTLNVTHPNPEFGTVHVNTLTLDGDFSGIYHKNLNLTLVAKPAPGYVFTGWEGMFANADSLVFRPTGDLNIRPMFVDVTSIDEPSEVPHPSRIELIGNWPNPFNPSTEIHFRVGTQDLASPQVHLQIFDMLGREVAVLVDGIVPAGEHRVTFDANGLSSGVYLIRLEAGGGVVTSRMTLLK